MKTNKTVMWNFIMNSLLTVSSLLFPLLTFPYVSRILAPEGIGKVTFATSLVTYFALFAQLGIPTYGIRACAQVRDDRRELTRTAHELLIINLLMSVAVYIVFGLVLAFVPRLQEDRILYIVISTMIILNAVGMEWLFRAIEEYTYITIRSLIFKLISVVGMFLLIHQPEDYIIYGGLTIVASHLSYVMNCISTCKYIDLKPVGGYNLKRHIKPVMVFFALACATTIYTNLDTVLLGFMKTDADVGYYSTAVKVKNILVSVVASLGTVLLPRVSYYVEHNQMDAFWKICKKALHFVLLLALPLTVYFVLFSKPSVLLLSGEEFLGSVLPMQICMPAVLFIGLTNIMGIQILVPLKKEKFVLYSVVVGAVVDLIINILLVPTMAATGSAIATLTAEASVLAVQFIIVRKDLQKIPSEYHITPAPFALIAGFLASAWVLGMPWGNFIMLAVSACLFFGVYGAVLLLLKERLCTELLRSVRQILMRSMQ